jgi:hypothetical protein
VAHADGQPEAAVVQPLAASRVALQLSVRSLVGQTTHSFSTPHAPLHARARRRRPARRRQRRFGANAATTLHTDVDMTLGDVRLEAGDYSLFVLYARGGWQLIVNRRTGIWGSDYDRTRNVAHIPLASRTLAEPEESLSVYLVPESARPAQGYAELRGVLRIKWGRTELSTTWRVAQ